MKKFKFPLDAVLVLRKSEMTKALGHYVEAQRISKELLATVENGKCRVDEMMLKMAEKRSRTFSVKSQQLELNLLKTVISELQTNNSKYLQSQQKENEIQKVFITSRQKVKLLETLREKRKNSFRKEEARQEEKQTEELVNANYSLDSHYV